VFLLVVFWFSALPHMEDLERRTSQAGKAAMAEDHQPPAGGAAHPKH
jgi:hypothetical protein